VVTLRTRTEAIGATTVVPVHPWTSPQAYGFISVTTLERVTTMMMIKPSREGYGSGVDPWCPLVS
jgi:hypothetical protein